MQCCSNTSKFLLQRLGVEVPFYEDKETTFDELQARIATTIELLEKTDAAVIDAKVNEPVFMETSMGNFRFETGQRYVSEYIIPNFHFHLTSAYCILRTQGVPLGALDYLKGVFVKVE